MAWEFDRIFEASITDPIDVHWNGRDVWVTAGNEVKIYSYWDLDAQYEKLYDADWFDDSIELDVFTSNFTLNEADSINQSNAGFMVQVGDEIYITDYITSGLYDFTWSSFTVYDATTHEYKRSASIGFNSNTIPFYGDNKIWFCDTAPQSQTGADRNKLYYLDTSDDSISAGVQIPMRKQFEPFKGAWDGDDYLVLLLHNNVAIGRFNSSTGAWVNSTRTNRHPRAIHVDSNKRVLIGSAGGMITELDTTTGVDTNVYGVNFQPESFVEGGTHIWSVINMDGEGAVNRLRKSDNDYKYMEPEDENEAGGQTEFTVDGTTFFADEALAKAKDGFTLSNQKLPSHGYSKIIRTQEFTYDYWNGSSFVTRTVKPYCAMISFTANKLYMFRDTALYRKNYLTQTSGAMIGTGQHQWHGD